MSEPRHSCGLAMKRNLSEVLIKDPSAVVNKFAAPFAVIVGLMTMMFNK